jgi:TonB family protein
MRGWQCVALAALLAVQWAICAAQGPDAVVRAARPALPYDPAKRCADLTTATTDQAVAVVVFRVGDTGVPSQPSVRSSSGSEKLDAAATACVLRLRYFPALRAGDGTAVDSWQQMTFGWKTPEQQAGTHCDPSATPAAATAKEPDAGAKPSLPRAGKVGVCVCLDESGKLAHTPTVLESAGDSGLDKAAIEIATTGRYQPTTQNGKAVSDCFPLTVKFEVK